MYIGENRQRLILTLGVRPLLAWIPEVYAHLVSCMPLAGTLRLQDHRHPLSSGLSRHDMLNVMQQHRYRISLAQQRMSKKLILRR